MLLRPEKHGQLLVHDLFESNGRYASPLHLTLRFNHQLSVGLCHEMKLSCGLVRLEVEMLLEGGGEEEVTEEGRVEQGLKDRVDVAGVAYVV